MKTFGEMRMETVITSLKRFFEDPNVETMRLDADLHPQEKMDMITTFFKLVDRSRHKTITLMLVTEKEPTTEKKKKRKLKKVNNYDKNGKFCPEPASFETPTTSHPPK